MFDYLCTFLETTPILLVHMAHHVIGIKGHLLNTSPTLLSEGDVNRQAMMLQATWTSRIGVVSYMLQTPVMLAAFPIVSTRGTQH